MKTNVKSKFWKPAYKALFLAAGLMGIQLSSNAQTITYIGEDAAEGTNIAVGNASDSSSLVTYIAPRSGTLYTNTTGSTLNIQLQQVNYQSGGTAGSIIPFVATYIGAQTATSDKVAANYTVYLKGDSIANPSGTSVHNVQFLSGGVHPVVTLNPGDVLDAGVVAVGSSQVRYQNTATGMAGYIALANTLPAAVPNHLTANATLTLDRTLKFNVGFTLASAGLSTTTTLSSSTANPTIQGSNVVFTATVSPAPTNGEVVTFMDGGTALGTGVLTSGQANFTNGTLTVGSHSITAVYAGDGYYFNSSSAALSRLVLYPFAGSYYIGDDAVEQTAVTAGNSQYGTAILTYAFVQGSTFSTYTNTSGSIQNVQLYQVNYFPGSGSGNITPYVATYTGGQTNTDVANGNNYNVLAIGDPITVTANSGAHTVPFLASGTNPVVSLNPGDVLVSGFVSSATGVVGVNTATTGLNDYIYNGNALPYPTAPGLLTANSSFSLDGTLKFNVGFVVNGSATVTAMTLNTPGNPWPQGSSLTFTATISPAPTNGEVVTFMDGTNTLGTGTLASGIATYTTSALAVGQHAIKAVYAYDGNYLTCNASLLQVIAAPFTGNYYIGDDAFEGANITAGNGSDSVTNLTYDFVQSGAGNYATYSNATASAQTIQLTQVNYFSGGSTNATVTPFVSIYTGPQTSAGVANGANYNVLLVGDLIATPTNSVNALNNRPFFVGGTNPIITLNPGDVLTAGYVVTGAGAVQFNSASSGLIDYIYNGNSLPGSTPGSLTANSTYSLDRTIKFNVGFALGVVPTTNTVNSSLTPSTYGSNVTFTATISPAPTNGELVVFKDGINTLGTGTLASGQASFTTNNLAVGSHSITAVYAGDGYYFPSISTAITQTVNRGPAQLVVSPVSSGQFQVSWPASNPGWILQAQTNSLTTGLGTNWVAVPGSGVMTNVIITIDPANGSVFLRLVSP